MIITRRDFIKGAAVFFLAAEIPDLARTSSLLSASSKKYVEKTIDIFGTQARISIFHNNVSEAFSAISAAFQELHRIDTLMSIFRKDSEISRLNELGFLRNMNEEVLYVIKKANYYSALSNGAFDISIQPLIESLESSAPLNSEIDYRRIEISGRSVRLENGMKITLGGIGIGYAIDRACETLQHRKIEHALVNIGGDIKAIGGKDKNLAWKVGIKNPENKGEFIQIIELKDAALATSGNYERLHIINPETRDYPALLKSTTIITKDCIDADALSTTTFILGKEKGEKLVKILGFEAVMV